MTKQQKNNTQVLSLALTVRNLYNNFPMGLLCDEEQVCGSSHKMYLQADQLIFLSEKKTNQPKNQTNKKYRPRMQTREGVMNYVIYCVCLSDQVCHFDRFFRGLSTLFRMTSKNHTFNDCSMYWYFQFLKIMRSTQDSVQSWSAASPTNIRSSSE